MVRVKGRKRSSKCWSFAAEPGLGS
jgi:hypothetical protein